MNDAITANDNHKPTSTTWLQIQQVRWNASISCCDMSGWLAMVLPGWAAQDMQRCSAYMYADMQIRIEWNMAVVELKKGLPTKRHANEDAETSLNEPKG